MILKLLEETIGENLYETKVTSLKEKNDKVV